jgi:hypothetical protein
VDGPHSISTRISLSFNRAFLNIESIIPGQQFLDRRLGNRIVIFQDMSEWLSHVTSRNKGDIGEGAEAKLRKRKVMAIGQPLDRLLKRTP